MRAAVLLAVLAVLAGCAALPGGDDATPGPTPGATATPTPTPRPIGLSASGVTDPYQLRAAHVRVLADQSYTFDYGLSVSWGGATRGRVSVTARVTADRSRALIRREVVGDVPTWLMPVGSTLRYDAGTTAYVRNPETNETTAEESPPGAAISDTYALDVDSVYLLLSNVDTAVTGTENVDGRTLFVVEGTADAMEASGGVARNVSVRAVVASSGLVVEFRAAYQLRREDPVGGGRSRVHVVHQISYGAVGETTVERPAWVPADAATPGADDSGGGTKDDGTAIGVGPPVVPTAPGPRDLGGPLGK